jgi:hypothetical protein
MFAIIVSLSLVTIQFAAQEYSHRIMEYYIKSVVFWATIVVYLGLMTAGILLQTQSSEADDIRVVSTISIGVILALALLVPHFLITASYLKPEFIVAKMIRRVDARYLSAISQLPVRPSADRLLPIVEITERSIDRGDLTTTRGALEHIENSYHEVGAPLGSANVDQYYIDHLSRVARKAMAAGDEEEASVNVVRMLGELGAAGPASLAVDAIEGLGVIAMRRDAEMVVRQMIGSLRSMYQATGSDDTKLAILAALEDTAERTVLGDRRRLSQHLAATVSEITSAEWEGGDHTR